MVFTKLILLFSSYVYANELPELVTKQATNNIRFLSQDGSLTYYQSDSGTLFLETKSNVKEVIKDSPNTQYYIYSSPKREKILIEKNNSFHQALNSFNGQVIYLLSWGGSDAVKVGNGINPKLHLQDQWLSFYRPDTQQIVFKTTTFPPAEFSIDIDNKVQPYFIPEAIMVNENLILFTDYDRNRILSIKAFDRIKGESNVYYSVPNEFSRLELCHVQDQLILGRWPYSSSKNGSSLEIIPLNDLSPKSFNERRSLYESELRDLGNMICQDKNIYFVKEISQAETQSITEVAELNLETKELKIITDLKSVGQMTTLDQTLIVSHLGKHYVLKGEYEKDSFKLNQ